MTQIDSNIDKDKVYGKIKKTFATPNKSGERKEIIANTKLLNILMQDFPSLCFDKKLGLYTLRYHAVNPPKDRLKLTILELHKEERLISKNHYITLPKPLESRRDHFLRHARLVQALAKQNQVTAKAKEILLNSGSYKDLQVRIDQGQEIISRINAAIQEINRAVDWEQRRFLTDKTYLATLNKEIKGLKATRISINKAIQVAQKERQQIRGDVSKLAENHKVMDF